MCGGVSTTATASLTIKNGTDTVVTIAKSTTAYAMVGMPPAGFASVKKGSVFTVVTDVAAVDAYVVILGTEQVYTAPQS